MQRIYVELESAAAQMQDSDLLLFRRDPEQLFRSPIAIGGRGEHSHAAKVGYVHGIPFCLEMREFIGGRAVTLRSQVTKFNGLIDVFETNPDNAWPHYNRAAATRAMWMKAGKAYNYSGVIWASLLHLPLVRVFVTPDLKDTNGADYTHPEFCSQAIANADRVYGGVDPVPNLSDRLTEPTDLARSPFYRYRFTLILRKDPPAHVTPCPLRPVQPARPLAAASPVSPTPQANPVAAASRRTKAETQPAFVSAVLRGSQEQRRAASSPSQGRRAPTSHGCRSKLAHC